MPSNDFNGDGRSDVLWLLEDNIAVSNWLATPSGGFTVNDANAFNWLTAWDTYDFQVTGDFNGDGRADLLWLVDATWAPWHMIWLSDANGGTAIGGPSVWFEVTDPSWRIAGSGDFNGDGIDDLLWRNVDGTISNWLGSASGAFTINDANAMTYVPNNWHILGTGDFNGDGNADILWQSDDGYISNWLGTDSGGFVINDANALTKMRVGVAAIGDFNGDQRDDIVIFDDWQFYSAIYADAQGGLIMDGYLPFALGGDGWWIVGAGDYNGDGIDDLLWRHQTGAFSNWLGTGIEHQFTVNDANAFAQVPVDWQVAGTPLL